MSTSESGAAADFTLWAQAAAPRLRRLGYLISGDWFLAEDLTQETLIRMYAVWRRVRRSGAPDAYAARTLINVNRSRLRVRRNREQPSPDLPDHPDPTPTGGDDLQERLACALGLLGPSQRAIVLLRYWEGLPEAEVADLLGLSHGAVKSQASRGLARLRDLLAAREPPAQAKEVTS